MSFSVQEAREPRIKADRRPRVNLCGECGDEIDETELLCEDCRRSDEGRWTPIKPLDAA